MDPEQIDPYRAYVQVTFVEPYFEEYEKKYRYNFEIYFLILNFHDYLCSEILLKIFVELFL